MERFYSTLAERLFGYQYAKEMLLLAHGSSERSAKWAARLPAVIKALNDEPTKLTGRKPSIAIKDKSVTQKLSMPATPERPILGCNVQVRYLYANGELEGGSKRATDPLWSLSTDTICNVVRKIDSPSMYYLVGGPACGFVHKELLVVPIDTEMPTLNVMLFGMQLIFSSQPPR